MLYILKGIHRFAKNNDVDKAFFLTPSINQESLELLGGVSSHKTNESNPPTTTEHVARNEELLRGIVTQAGEFNTPASFHLLRDELRFFITPQLPFLPWEYAPPEPRKPSVVAFKSFPMGFVVDGFTPSEQSPDRKAGDVVYAEVTETNDVFSITLTDKSGTVIPSEEVVTWMSDKDLHAKAAEVCDTPISQFRTSMTDYHDNIRRWPDGRRDWEWLMFSKARQHIDRIRWSQTAVLEEIETATFRNAFNHKSDLLVATEFYNKDVELNV